MNNSVVFEIKIDHLPIKFEVIGDEVIVTCNQTESPGVITLEDLSKMMNAIVINKKNKGEIPQLIEIK